MAYAPDHYGNPIHDAMVVAATVFPHLRRRRVWGIINNFKKTRIRWMAYLPKQTKDNGRMNFASWWGIHYGVIRTYGLTPRVIHQR